MQNQWILKKTTEPEPARIIADLFFKGNRYGLILAHLLVQRNADTIEKVQKFLNPGWEDAHDPFLMKGMTQAISRLAQAVKNKEPLFLYGDYDVDGTTSVSLFSHCLSDWGVPFDYHIPDREKEGYGLSYEGIQRAEGKYSLMIVLDCGTKEAEKVRFAKERGIDMIICDHHTPGKELPEAFAFLNPRQEGCRYPYKELSACGVGFKLLDALNRYLIREQTPGHDPEYDVFSRYGELVALSIACDIVPITDENRLLAKKGIEKLRANPIKGIRQMMALSETSRSWNISDLVFFIGPRINSAGRLDSAKGAVEVLSGKKEDLRVLTQKLEEMNAERREMDLHITREALEMFASEYNDYKPFATILFNENWHKGVIGIVASRLIEHHYQPTILLTRKGENKWVGSGRSIEGFDLYAALLECGEHIDQFGGHMYAAGLTINDNKLEHFKKKFQEVAEAQITEEMRRPKLEIDLELDFNALEINMPDSIDVLEPFGPGNPEPIFMTRGVLVKEARILKEAHLRLKVQKNARVFTGIGFSLASKWLEMGERTEFIDIAWRPSINRWTPPGPDAKEIISLQLMIKDIRKAGLE